MGENVGANMGYVWALQSDRLGRAGAGDARAPALPSAQRPGPPDPARPQPPAARHEGGAIAGQPVGSLPDLLFAYDFVF